MKVRIKVNFNKNYLENIKNVFPIKNKLYIWTVSDS